MFVRSVDPAEAVDFFAQFQALVEEVEESVNGAASRSGSMVRIFLRAGRFGEVVDQVPPDEVIAAAGLGE